jgi:threonine dehydrogenase-like Zn-dependent dehydrogenase
VSEHRLEIAQACGVTHLSNARNEPLREAAARVFGSSGFDLAFDCAGVQETIAAAVENLQKGGTLVLVAVYGEHPRVHMGLVQDRELTLTGTLMYRHADFVRAVDLIRSGKVLTGPLETAHFSLERFGEAYRFIDQTHDQTMKVFIDV